MVTAILTIIVLYMNPMLGVEKLFLKDILINKPDISKRVKSSIPCVCVCLYAVLSCSVVSHSLRPFAFQPTRLHCPRDFSGKNTGVGCRFLLQGIFSTQGSKQCLLCLLHCRQILYLLSYPIYYMHVCVCVCVCI